MSEKRPRPSYQLYQIDGLYGTYIYEERGYLYFTELAKKLLDDIVWNGERKSWVLRKGFGGNTEAAELVRILNEAE